LKKNRYIQTAIIR